jgi:hypothetical protein
MKYGSIAVALLLFVMIFVYCGSKSTSPSVNNPVPDNKITLDTGSALLSAFTIQARSGATLTIDSGTIILMSDSGVYQPVPANATVLITLDDGDSSSVVAISGISTVALFRISATVNGNAADLQFVSPAAATTTAGMPVSGAHWSAQLTDTAIHAGTRICLYKITGSSYSLIGSQYAGIPTKVLAKAAGPGQPTNVSPNGTGPHQVGADNGQAPSTSGTIPSGTYWNVYSSIPDTTIVIGSDTFGGPLTVGYMEIGELSTDELVAGFTFGPGVTSATWTNPNDGAQYWAALTQSAEGKTTSIKVGATVANIFYLSMRLVNANTRQAVLFVTGLQPDGNVVHAPDGSMLADPYQNSSLKISGFKELKFSCKNFADGEKVEGLVRDAGYQISHMRFVNSVYQFDVALTLDGRKLIEEKILQPNGWLPRPADDTWRNRGFYDFDDTLFINISSHGVKDTVDDMTQTVTGTFTDGAGDPDTVKKMTVVWTDLGQTKTADATLGNGGTSFSVDCDLYTSDNLFIFQPYIIDKNGDETYQSHFIMKAKGTRTKQFVINYSETRKGQLVVHKVTTSRENEPDTSVTIDDETVTATLTMTPNQIVLNELLGSANNATACASSQTCSILDGTNDSGQAVTVAETYQKKAKNCDGNLPIIDMDHWTGSMTFTDAYLANMHVSLLPPGTGSRQYCLVVQTQPTLAITSNPNHAGSGQYFDCVDSVWKSETPNIDPAIRLTKSDDPIVLVFTSAASLESYVDTPTTAATWTLHGTQYSADSMTVTQYDATLTVSP